MSINIDPTKLREEAYRLEKMGVLDITWGRDDGAIKTGKFVVVGFGVDGNEHDCLMVAGPYGMSGKNIHRFIIASNIREIKVSETQSFNRYGTMVNPRPTVPNYRLSEADMAFLNDVANGNGQR